MFGITSLLASRSTRPSINITLKVKRELMTGPYLFVVFWTRFGRYVPILKTSSGNKKESPSCVDKRYVFKFIKNTYVGV